MKLISLRLTLILCLTSSLLFPATGFIVNAQRETPEQAFSSKADNLLKEVRRAAEEDRKAEKEGRLKSEGSEVARLSKHTGLARKSDGSLSVGVAVELNQESAAELRAAGFEVGARVGDVATVRTDVDRLPELAALSSVRKVSASVRRYPKNDRARQGVGIDNSSGRRVVSQTGRGVVVGILDTGIDFRHLDFTVPGSGGKQTRIKAMLDMTYYGTSSSLPPDPGWNYTLPGQSATIGHLYTEADINAALAENPKPDQSADIVKERDKAGHGTHVASTAAGNGLSSPTPGTYMGMAPEADLIIVKASRENDGNDGFGTTDIINGINFIAQKAAELGEPYVINMSIGGHAGSPHDGTDPEEKVVDSLAGSGTGRAICIAAGNEGQSGIHASGNVGQGSDVALTLNSSSNPGSFTLYYPNSDRFSLTVTLPDNTTLNSGAFNGASARNQYIRIINGTDDKQDSDPSNDQSSFFVIINDGAEKLGSKWTFTLHGNSVTSGGHFDAWVEDGTFAAPFADDSREVASPGTARGALTVGAYVTRSATQVINNYAFFTSPGPTADGRQKPDISTPGYYLYSARSGDITSDNSSSGTVGTGNNASTDFTHYIGFAGTSMATPVATGSVALLLQANRNLSVDQIKQAINATATHDNFTGGGWEAHFGNGKLNIAAALNSVAPPATNQIDGSQFFVTQHYLDFLNRQPDAGGLGYWSSQIDGDSSNNPAPCSLADKTCLLRRRISVSAAFFIENEFQQTGSYVYRLYTTTLGRQPSYAEFTSDRSQIIAGSGLDQSKQTFADNWVQRTAFTNKYSASLSPDAFVDALLTTLKNYDGVNLSAKRATYISELQSGAGRGQVVREMAEDAAVQSTEYNPSFVLMQYFGYLRRDPDAGGYQFWLDVLNNKEPNNYRGMVCSFITSAEYQARFGSVITFSNQDCGKAQ